MTPLSTRTETAARADAAKYLTFQLGTESYGIDVLKIREIIRLQPATPVPQMPAYVKGVINLRGKIIPVIDLRLRFGLPGIQDSDRTCIVVVQVSLPSRPAVAMGLVVDGVEEVVNISPDEVEEAPDFGGRLQADYLRGLAKLKSGVKTLLDIDRVMAGEELEELPRRPKA